LSILNLAPTGAPPRDRLPEAHRELNAETECRRLRLYECAQSPHFRLEILGRQSGGDEWRRSATTTLVAQALQSISFTKTPSGFLFRCLPVTARFKRAGPAIANSSGETGGTKSHYLARLLGEVLEPFDRFKDSAGFLDFDAEALRAPGTLPIRASPARTRSQARCAAASKSTASAARTCQPVTGFPST
jgi:hypothetical protein